LRSTPTEGSIVGARSIWKEEHSMTWCRPLAGGWSDRIAARERQEMRDQRRRRRFAVGAGDRGEGRLRHMPAPLAAEELDVADDLDARGLGPLHRPVRLWMRKRHSGREDKTVEVAPVRLAEIDRADALRDSRRDRVALVVPGRHLGAPGFERRRRRTAARAEAEDRDAFSVEAGDRDHRRITGS
jgi:hypothetical protein